MFLHTNIICLYQHEMIRMGAMSEEQITCQTGRLMIDNTVG